jgi:hypothetical protein
LLQTPIQSPVSPFGLAASSTTAQQLAASLHAGRALSACQRAADDGWGALCDIDQQQVGRLALLQHL